MRTLLSLAVLAAAASSTACSTSYSPQNSGRISVVMEGGSPELYKNGRTYKPGLFGGNVDEAVAGNARAEEEAETYQTHMTTGAILSFAGLGLELGGAALLAASPPSSSGNNALFPSLGLMLGGAVAAVVSLAFTMSAQPHLWDAINIYNDGVKEPPRAP
jgi:hypothetical protein